MKGLLIQYLDWDRALFYQRIPTTTGKSDKYFNIYEILALMLKVRKTNNGRRLKIYFRFRFVIYFNMFS